MWVVFAILVSTQSILFAESTLSKVSGRGALNWILRDPELRNKISISEEQLSDIRKTLDDKTLFRGDEIQIESFARIYFSKTLTKTQANLLRIEHVKTSFGSPVHLFYPVFLSELGLDSNEASRIYQLIAQKQEVISKKADRLRIEAVESALPPYAQEVLWSAIGKHFTIEENGIDLVKVTVFAEITPFLQLSQSSYTVVPKKLQLSNQQRERLINITTEIQRNMGDGVKCPDAEIEQHLDTILSRAQRFAIIQSVNQLLVRNDLLTVINPNMAKQYKLGDEFLAEAKAELSERSKVITEMEKLQLIHACREVLPVVPLQVRNVITELATGVWDL